MAIVLGSCPTEVEVEGSTKTELLLDCYYG